MALILGDIHGNFDKAEKFLAFKPEEKHVFVGDYVDSFEETDEQILLTLKLCIESDATLLLGNHDLHYFTEPPFTCSGRRYWLAKGLNEIFEAFLDRFVPAAVVDGFLITHGGLSEGLGNSFKVAATPEAILDRINAEWSDYLNTRIKRAPHAPRKHHKIFNISFSRGGRDSFAGIFWADYRDDKFFGVPQVFGHSRTEIGNIVNIAKDAFSRKLNKNTKVDFWAIGCDNDRRICFNSTTKEIEDFG